MGGYLEDQINNSISLSGSSTLLQRKGGDFLFIMVADVEVQSVCGSPICISNKAAPSAYSLHGLKILFLIIKIISDLY